MVWSKLTLTQKTILNRLVLVVSIVASLLVISVSVRSGAWARPEREENASNSSTQAQRGRRLEVELVTITADGFEPQEIRRTPGPFILAVRNRSGIDSLNIQIDDEQRNKIRDKSLPLETPYWREVITAPPGKYTVTEVNHPDWSLSLTIQ